MKHMIIKYMDAREFEQLVIATFYDIDEYNLANEDNIGDYDGAYYPYIVHETENPFKIDIDSSVYEIMRELGRLGKLPIEETFYIWIEF